jgi:cytochrome P450
VLDFDPYSNEVMADPWPAYARLRAESPVHYVERYDCWFLSRFEDVYAACTQGEVFSAETGVSPGQILLREPPPPQTFLTMDLPRQRVHRALVGRSYTRKAVASLEPTLRGRVRTRLRSLAGRGKFDVVADVAVPVVTETIADLIGLDAEDAHFLRTRIERFFAREPGQVGTSNVGAIAIGEFMERAHALVAELRNAPSDREDHLSAWCSAAPEGAPLSNDEIVGNLFGLLVTGIEVVPLAVGNTLHALHHHPDIRRTVVSDPALIEPAFAESLRYDQPTNLLGRRLKVDTEIHGKRLSAGQGVMFLWASANRDEREFERADQFELDRAPKRTLSYGHGVHKCLGEHLGNLEGRVLLEEVLSLVPDYTLGEGVRRAYGEFLHGTERLPIEFTPRELRN